jgi:hypothetical protein
VLFGKRRRSAATRQPGREQPSSPPEMYTVAYEQMLKGNKLSRRGRPIRQAAIVVRGTVTLITSGDSVDRKTYEALISAGVLTQDGDTVVPEVIAADAPLDSQAEDI